MFISRSKAIFTWFNTPKRMCLFIDSCSWTRLPARLVGPTSYRYSSGEDAAVDGQAFALGGLILADGGNRASRLVQPFRPGIPNDSAIGSPPPRRRTAEPRPALSSFRKCAASCREPSPHRGSPPCGRSSCTPSTGAACALRLLSHIQKLVKVFLFLPIK